MSAPWLKWFPTDWRADAGLRQCSIGARGLWIELLGYMHEAQPYGFLLINGRKPTNAEIAKLVGIHHNAVTPLVTELVTHGVTGVATDGVLFSRRMVRDHEKALQNKHNGHKGGNPALAKTVNPQDKAQNPDARSQTPERKKAPLPPTGGKRPRTPKIPIPPDYAFTSEHLAYAKTQYGWDAHRAQLVFSKMKNKALAQNLDAVCWLAEYQRNVDIEVSYEMERNARADRIAKKDPKHDDLWS